MAKTPAISYVSKIYTVSAPFSPETPDTYHRASTLSLAIQNPLRNLLG